MNSRMRSLAESSVICSPPVTEGGYRPPREDRLISDLAAFFPRAQGTAAS